MRYGKLEEMMTGDVGPAGIAPCYVFYLTTYDYALPRLAAARLDGVSVLELHWQATSGKSDERAVMVLLENGAYVPTAIVQTNSPADTVMFLNSMRHPVANSDSVTFLADNRAGRTRNVLPGDLICASRKAWLVTPLGIRSLVGVNASEVFEVANGWLFERSTEKSPDIQPLDVLREQS